jgi:hypothetical protein
MSQTLQSVPTVLLQKELVERAIAKRKEFIRKCEDAISIQRHKIFRMELELERHRAEIMDAESEVTS